MIKFSESVRKKDVQVFDVNTQIIEIEIDLILNILIIDLYRVSMIFLFLCNKNKHSILLK